MAAAPIEHRLRKSIDYWTRRLAELKRETPNSFTERTIAEVEHLIAGKKNTLQAYLKFRRA